MYKKTRHEKNSKKLGLLSKYLLFIKCKLLIYFFEKSNKYSKLHI